MLIVDEPYRLAFQWSNYESFTVNKLKRKQGVIPNYVTILNGKKKRKEKKKVSISASYGFTAAVQAMNLYKYVGIPSAVAIKADI